MLELLQKIDNDLLLAINGCNSEWMDRIILILTNKLTWLPLYLLCIWLLIRQYGIKRGIGLTIVIIATIGIADIVAHDVIKCSVCRMRPANLNNPISEYIHIVAGHRGGRYSFPSNHATNCATLSVMICYYIRQQRIRWIMGIWTLINCYSRLYMGVHYPSDIIGGLILGSAVAIIAIYITNQSIKIWNKDIRKKILRQRSKF